MSGGRRRPFLWSGWLLAGVVLTVWGLVLTLSGLQARRALDRAVPLTAAELRPGDYVRGTVTGLLCTFSGDRAYPVTITDALTETTDVLTPAAPGRYVVLRAPRALGPALEVDGGGRLAEPLALLAQVKRGLPYGLHEEGIRAALDLPADAPLGAVVSEELYLWPVSADGLRSRVPKGLCLLLAGLLALAVAERERRSI